jgi:hypothetical protein
MMKARGHVDPITDQTARLDKVTKAAQGRELRLDRECCNSLTFLEKECIRKTNTSPTRSCANLWNKASKSLSVRTPLLPQTRF